MNKYFMKGTEDELQFGDMIELDCVDTNADGTKSHHRLECRFVPDLIPLLLEDDIIEIQETEDDESEDYENDCPSVAFLNIKIAKLESEVDELKSFLKNLFPKSFPTSLDSKATE